MSYITDAEWAEYRDIIDEAHSDFNQQVIKLWKKDPGIDRYQENDVTYTDTDLLCLIQYNIFRTWPMAKDTPSGILDEESIAIYLNITYLNSISMLTADGNLKFDPGVDYFELQGLRYRSAGETPVAQAKNQPLMLLLILKRIPINTAEGKY